MEEIHMHPFVFIVSLLVEKGRHLFSKSRQRLFQPSVLMGKMVWVDNIKGNL